MGSVQMGQFFFQVLFQITLKSQFLALPAAAPSASLSPAQPAPQQIPGCRRKHALLLIPQKHLLAFSDLASKRKGFALQLHGQRMGRAGLEGRLQTPTEPKLSPAPGTAQLSRALLRGSRGYLTPNSQKREQKHLAEDLD